MAIRILYHDEHLAVAVKPAGVLSQPDRTGEDSMVTMLAAELKREVYPVHRLDRAVGGVMVLALTKQAAGKLSAMVGSDAFTKTYLAAAYGIPTPQSGNLQDYLIHDARRNMTRVGREGERDAKCASLSYEVLSHTDTASLVRVRLHTGRTHQIRVQFSSRGMPLLGDRKYGSDERCPIGLWSYHLAFLHPVSKKRMAFTAYPAWHEPWDRFPSIENESQKP
ncbi:MAG: RluA family pseudouridine synthase [Clostridia bacterium]|nr:RluA family pseudouridine synthase [Clostridia bacterium]